jgi:hypothetical protein
MVAALFEDSEREIIAWRGEGEGPDFTPRGRCILLGGLVKEQHALGKAHERRHGDETAAYFTGFAGNRL